MTALRWARTPAVTLRWWRRRQATRRARTARRVLRRNRDVLELPRLLRAAMADRGTCAACGDEHALRRDGRVHGHGHGCPGGGELPAPITGRTT
jgi:hypothetical protein